MHAITSIMLLTRDNNVTSVPQAFSRYTPNETPRKSKQAKYTHHILTTQTQHKTTSPAPPQASRSGVISQCYLSIDKQPSMVSHASQPSPWPRQRHHQPIHWILSETTAWHWLLSSNEWKESSSASCGKFEFPSQWSYTSPRVSQRGGLSSPRVWRRVIGVRKKRCELGFTDIEEMWGGILWKRTYDFELGLVVTCFGGWAEGGKVQQ